MTGGFKIDEEDKDPDLGERSEITDVLKKSSKKEKNKDEFNKKKVRALYGYRSSVKEIEKAFTKNPMANVHVHTHNKPCDSEKKKKKKK